MDPFVGEIKLLPWPWAPKGWHICDGSLLPVAQNQALFSLLGTQYGGNGQTNFGLPDLRGRTPVHYGNSSYPQTGVQAGTENVTLNTTQLPAHNHNLLGYSVAASTPIVTNAAFATVSSGATPINHYAPDSATIPLIPDSVQPAGGNQPHDNMQPFLVLNYCIALVGVYPSRN